MSKPIDFLEGHCTTGSLRYGAASGSEHLQLIHHPKHAIYVGGCIEER
jgi:hypothetical protein